MIIRKPNKKLRCTAAYVLGLALALCPAVAQDDDTPADADTPIAEDATPDADTPSEETTSEETTPAEDTPTTGEQADDTPAPQDTADDAKPEPKKNPRRAASYIEALDAAGEDGIAVFCYGPDWNSVSTRMLKSFWETPEVEAATGAAILVAAPFYEDPTPEQEETARGVTAGMRNPPFGVCPTIMLFDKDGTMYANMPGADFLGTEDDEFKQGIKNLQEKIGALRKRYELMKKAELLTGVAKAKVLNEIAELPIIPPKNLVDQIREADEMDQSGMVRRNTFSALGFLYEQMNTKDGFLLASFEPDYNKISADCMKVIKDETLRPIDRQAAYLLMIGQARREEITGTKLKNMVNGLAKLDPNTKYGRLAPVLNNSWVTRRIVRTKEEESAMVKRNRDKKKDQKNKANADKKAEKNGEVR